MKKLKVIFCSVLLAACLTGSVLGEPALEDDSSAIDNLQAYLSGIIGLVTPLLVCPTKQCGVVCPDRDTLCRP